jgi:hypothetical protein
VRSDGEQPLTFRERLAYQPELVLLEVAQAAVDQLGAGGGGVRGQVVLLDEADAQPASRGVPRDAGTVDAATDDQQVEDPRIDVQVPISS